MNILNWFINRFIAVKKNEDPLLQRIVDSIRDNPDDWELKVKKDDCGRYFSSKKVSLEVFVGFGYDGPYAKIDSRPPGGSVRFNQESADLLWNWAEDWEEKARQKLVEQNRADIERKLDALDSQCATG